MFLFFLTGVCVCVFADWQVGICDEAAALDVRAYERLFGKDAHSVVWDHESGIMRAGQANISASFSSGDNITITLDFPAKKLSFGKGTSSYDVALTPEMVATAWYPCACSTLSGGSVKLVSRSGTLGSPLLTAGASAVAPEAAVAVMSESGQETMAMVSGMWHDVLNEVVTKKLVECVDFSKYVCWC